MIPIQYRLAETEEILERRHETEAPDIGSTVQIGFGRYDVLFRWRCVPTSCIVYVRPASERLSGMAARAA